MAQGKEFTKWREAIRKALRNIKIFSQVFKKHYEYKDGRAFFCCPHTRGNFSIFHVAQEKFHCECGYVGRGDVFSLAMHLEGLPFGKVLTQAAGATRILTPGQLRRRRNKQRRQEKSGGMYLN
ncbi:MAG: hypothetical protein WAV16_01680 [Candidatus Moraniibacteriota bacterium]